MGGWDSNGVLRKLSLQVTQVYIVIIVTCACFLIDNWYIYKGCFLNNILRLVVKNKINPTIMWWIFFFGGGGSE